MKQTNRTNDCGKEPSGTVSRPLRLVSSPLVVGFALLAAHRFPKAILQRAPGTLEGVGLNLFAELPTFVLGLGLGTLVVATSRRWIRASIGLFAFFVVAALAAGEAKRAVLGSGPNWADLYFLETGPGLNASIKALSAHLSGAIGLGGFLILLAFALVGRTAPIFSKPFQATSLGLAFGAISLTMVVPFGHVFGSLLRSPIIEQGHALVIQEKLTEAKVDALLSAMTGTNVSSSFARKYPLCAAWPVVAPTSIDAVSNAPSPTATVDSAVVLLIEGLGTEAMRREVKGQDVMPFLRDLSRKTTTLTRFRAVGTKTSRAFLALFSGVPVIPGRRLLHLRPLRKVEPGLQLLANGRRQTPFAMAADAAFEQLGQFMRKVGATEIHDRQVKDDVPPLGWGVDDKTFLRRVRLDLEARLQTPSFAPFFYK